jgi:hypothetical protein
MMKLPILIFSALAVLAPGHSDVRSYTPFPARACTPRQHQHASAPCLRFHMPTRDPHRPDAAHAADRVRGPLAPPPLLTQLQQVAAAGGSIATYATPDLLLKHPDETFVTYI